MRSINLFAYLLTKHMQEKRKLVIKFSAGHAGRHIKNRRYHDGRGRPIPHGVVKGYITFLCGVRHEDGCGPPKKISRVLLMEIRVYSEK